MNGDFYHEISLSCQFYLATHHKTTASVLVQDRLYLPVLNCMQRRFERSTSIRRNQTSTLLHRKSLSLSKRWGVSLAMPSLFRPAELNVTRPLQRKVFISLNGCPVLTNLTCQLQYPPASLEYPHFPCVLCVFVPYPCVCCAMSRGEVPTYLVGLLRMYSMTPGAVHLYTRASTTPI